MEWQKHVPTPCTLHPTPYTLHPTSYTLHPTPYPASYTLHPTPYALSPESPIAPHLLLPSQLLHHLLLSLFGFRAARLGDRRLSLPARLRGTLRRLPRHLGLALPLHQERSGMRG